VLVLDLNMAGESSLHAIPRLREFAPGTQIVVLTMQENPAFAREALRSETETDGRLDGLSPRELEALKLIALGHTNGEIASSLFLSVRTVKSRRAHIQQKVRLTTRAELVSYVRDHGLLD
jgi:two-component system response regulator NreC